MSRLEILIELLLVILAVSSDGCEDSLVNKEDCSVGVGHVDYCKTDVNYCMNRGFCYNLGGESLCRCSGDFEGQRCQWRPCPSSPNNYCGKEGLCYWRPGMYPVRKICRCLSSSEGRYCNEDGFGAAEIETTTMTTPTETATEIEKSSTTIGQTSQRGTRTTAKVKVAADLCEAACENGGKCSEDGRRCDCPICCDGQRCETCRDPCEGVLCNDGGRCSVDSQCRAHCDCSTTAFIGHDCKYKRTCNPCDEEPCLNQGECSVKDGRYECTCRSGWSGQRCQWRTPPHDCRQDCEKGGQVCAQMGTSWVCVPLWQSKCDGLNNCSKESVCTNHYGRYECLCRKSGYKGVSCVEAPNVCDAAVNPCLYGATCVPTGGLNGTYICRCPPHLDGPHCDVCNACEPNPCQNGGRCQPFGEVTQLNFKCLCNGRQRGRFCQMSQNPCNMHKCFHSKFGGKCRVNEFDEPICECPSGFVGAHCEAENMCARRPCDSFGTKRCRPLVEQNYFECVCQPGFQGYACQYTDDQVGSEKFCADFLPCGRERGACEVEDGRLNCECGQPNMGLNCERDNCSLGRNPCVRGRCQMTKKGTAFCNCSANGRRHTDALFGGPRCNKFKGLTACSTSLCRGRGRCVWPASGFGLVACACEKGYVVDNCDLETTTMAVTVRKVADPCEIAKALKKCRSARCERLSDSVAICRPLAHKRYNFTSEALKKCVDVHCFGRKECLYYARIGKAVCLEVPRPEVRQLAASATSTLPTTARASTTSTSATILSTNTTSTSTSQRQRVQSATPSTNLTSTSVGTPSTNFTSTSTATSSPNSTSTDTSSPNSTSTSAGSTTASTTSSWAATVSASPTSTLTTTTTTSASKRTPTPTATTNIASIAGVGVGKAATTTTAATSASTSVAGPTPTTGRAETSGVRLATTTTREAQQVASSSSKIAAIVLAGIVGVALLCLLCLLCVCLFWWRRRRRRVHVAAKQQEDKAERREEVGRRIRHLSEEKTAAIEKAKGKGSGEKTAPPPELPAKGWNELARTSDGEEILSSPIELSVSVRSDSDEDEPAPLLPEESTESSEEDSEESDSSSSSTTSDSLEAGDKEQDWGEALQRIHSSKGLPQEEDPTSSSSSNDVDTESTQKAGRPETWRLESEPVTKAGLVLLLAGERPSNNQSSLKNRKTLTFDVPEENVAKRRTLLNAVDEHEELAPPSPQKISTAQLRQRPENSDGEVLPTNERDIDMVNSKVMLAPIGSSDDEEDLETPPPSPKQEENEQPQPKQEQISSVEFGGSDQ